ncbi:MAG: galactosyldiacylglycerol synthase [Anaerolineae bacterium]|nr:galactosyldiacylglycerol synthase [Anaerolineae bacterium]
MIQLFDASSGALIGQITEAQLQFLITHLEEESADDQDYYINRDTLDLFQANGAEPALLELLRTAMGEREETEIRWSRG